MYTLVGILEHRAPEDAEELYRAQLEARGFRGKIRRQDQLKSQVAPIESVEYNEKIRKLTSRALASQIVVASWYGGNDGFVGKCKANGEFFDDGRFTVAHRELPLGTLVALERAGKFALAMVTDRGPYVEGRDLDVSRAIAEYLGVGVTPVTMYVLRVPKVNVTFHRDNPSCLGV